MKALRPYQQEAFDLVWNRIEGKKETRALVVLATGLGKTVLAAALARRWFSERTDRLLFLVHTVDIVRQARKEFREVLHELTTIGILTGSEAENLDAQVLFSTFQSMQNRLKTVKPDTFGFVIVDEAHHGQAVTYKEVIEHFTPEFLLGMTATPDRHDGEDIRDIFGPELCAFPLQWGIVEGWLSPVEYRVLADNISIMRLRELIRQAHEGVRVSRKSIDSTIFLPERTEVIVDIVRNAQGGEKRTILFCRSIEHLNHVLEFFPEALAYHSKIPETELRRRYDDFREGRIQTLATIDMFNEGIDIPDAELLVFLRATDSRLLWLQQLGRGLHGTKKVLVLDFVANCDRVKAVQELGLTPTIHTGSLPESVTIDDLNLQVTFTEELRDLLGLLDFLDMGFYETYEEARAAVAKLNPPWDGRLIAWFKKNARRDPRIPRTPWSVYEGNGWVSIRHFCDRDYYQTIGEAMLAVQVLNPPWEGKLDEWYRRVYKLDQRLPSAPWEYYRDKGWVSIRHFCGREFYTHEEARKAIVCLNPPWGEALSAWYKTNRHRDPRLPSTPSLYYRDKGWVSIRHFCGREFYTHEEARKAIVCLNPPWGEDLSAWYKTNRHRDSQLPGNPWTIYKNKGWVSIRHFCGREFYPTLKEAMVAVQALNPPPDGNILRWYLKIYKKDPRLPACPWEYYADKGWISWPHFCGREKT